MLVRFVMIILKEEVSKGVEPSGNTDRGQLVPIVF